MSGKNLFAQIERRLHKLRLRLLIDTGDYRKTVFLAGTGRSGTTWLEEIINSRNEYRLMFEPFNQRKVELVGDWNYRQYLRTSERSDKYLNPATSILSGAIRNEWIDWLNKKFYSRKRLVKDIRANLFLKWIKKNFPEIPIILILRHPCAVASSKIKLGWETHLEDFLAQDELMQDYLSPVKAEIEKANGHYDKHIFMWCIENCIPLQQFDEEEILVVFYEHLCVNPLNEIEKIMAFLGKDYSVENFHNINKPSALARKDSAVVSGGDLIDEWRKHINDRQIDRALEILRLFGMHKIYDKKSLPLLTGQEALKILSS